MDSPSNMENPEFKAFKLSLGKYSKISPSGKPQQVYLLIKRHIFVAKVELKVREKTLKTAEFSVNHLYKG